MSQKEYHFRTDWPFQAPVDRVWPIIMDIEHYPAWWRDFRRVRLRAGDGRAVGSIFDCEVRGALPYSLNYTMEVTRGEPHRSVELRSTGDLVGTGRWEFSNPRPGATVATYFWDVRMNRLLLNLLAPVGRGFFSKNHELVMARGYQALRHHVEGASA